MNTVTGQDIHDSIFLDDENSKALDCLLLALAEGKKDDTVKFLSVLRKAAHSALHELSCEKDFVDWMEGIEHDDFVASINHAAMM